MVGGRIAGRYRLSGHWKPGSNSGGGDVASAQPEKTQDCDDDDHCADNVDDVVQEILLCVRQ
jgi:hypothetical protein